MEPSAKHALIALHFQNDICHPNGRIPFSLDRAFDASAAFLLKSHNMLHSARRAGWTVIHVRMAFASDYSDLPRNSRLFRAVEPLGALQRGSWGAGPLAGFEPEDGETVIVRNRNSAFRETGLDPLLRGEAIRHVAVMGLATQFSVEHTVRDASDLGYDVTVIADCCASADADAHRASLRTMGMLADVLVAADLLRRESDA